MRSFIRILLVSLCPLASACVVHDHHDHGHPHGMPPGQAKKVSHVHGHDCGHCCVDGVWVEIPVGHVHGDHCGHYVVNGAWHGGKAKGKSWKH